MVGLGADSLGFVGRFGGFWILDRANFEIFQVRIRGCFSFLFV
jgi:hypothetical protein